MNETSPNPQSMTPLFEKDTEMPVDRSTAAQGATTIESLDERLKNLEGTEGESLLSEDTLSFIIAAEKIQPFILGVLVFLLKTVIYCFFVTNIVDWKAKFNKLGIPVNTSSSPSSLQSTRMSTCCPSHISVASGIKRQKRPLPRLAVAGGSWESRWCPSTHFWVSLHLSY